MNTFEVIAFESREREGMFTADGPEIAFTLGDENGEVEDLEHAMLLIRDDLKRPTDEDLENHYKLFDSLKLYDSAILKDFYKSKRVRISKQQMNVVRERNEW